MRRWRLMLQDAWEGARRHPARVALPFAGITLGMLALTILLSLVAGLRRQTETTIAELGINVFSILQNPSDSPSSFTPLTRRHASLLRASLPGSLVAGIRAESYPLSPGAPAAAILGADEQCFAVRPWPVLQGRPLDAADLRDHSAVAVISDTLARELQAGPGNTVSLGPVVFRVVGITAVEAGAADSGAAAPALTPGERLMVIPWTVPPYWRNNNTPPDNRLDAIFVRSREARSLDGTLQTARHLLADPRQSARPLSWVTPRSLVERLLRLRQRIMLAGGAIVILCLLMGGITLGSLMLSNIQTRIPEIGLRRALGASAVDISLLCLIEALLLTLSASALGSGLAFCLLAGAGKSLPVPTALGTFLLTVPLAAGLALGLAFSYLPARTAARIAPAEALRNE